MDARIDSINVKIAPLDAQLKDMQKRMAGMRDGPGKAAMKQKALKVLRQKKQYEASRDQLEQQSWNMVSFCCLAQCLYVER